MLANLRKLREELGISQQRLGEAVSISQQSINKYENHNVQPDIDTLKRLADFFNTSIDFLVGHTSIRNKIELTTTYDLNEDEEQCLLMYQRLSGKEKSGIRALLKELARKE